MIAPTPAKVVVATVTYGERRHVLLPVLDRLREEGVGKVVVIDNGATWPVTQELKNRFGGWARIVPMGGNTGSARGFHTAIAEAMREDLPWVWLLDDDNLPRRGCLALLLSAWGDERKTTATDSLVVAACRPEHFSGHVSAKQLKTRWDSFGGFHFADVPGKVLRRLPLPLKSRLLSGEESIPSRLELGVAPYGGLLLHNSVLQRIGLPRTDFAQYCDDTEFTWRITQAGGNIVQVTDAVIDDIDAAFQQNAQLRNRFKAALLAKSDFRTYYTFRNLAFFEYNLRRRRTFTILLNRLIYFGVLRYYAFRLGKFSRFRFIREATRDGIAGRLGENKNYPIL